MRLPYLLLLALLATACVGIQPRLDKQDFEADTYMYKRNKKKQGWHYAYPVGDSVRLYAIESPPVKGQPRPTAQLQQRLHLPDIAPDARGTYAFLDPSLDVDLFTAPIKYRPATPEYPHQLQPVVNLNAYVGYRVDRYAYQYVLTPAGFYKRKFTHYGLSVGGFMGSGSEHIFPEVLKTPITGEYDGWIWSKGAALFFGAQHVTVGLLVGTDELIDRNRRAWVYHEKLWIGLGFGINLN